MSTPIKIDKISARRFLLTATGITHPFAGTHEALQHLGFIQIDPINVCGRMHEHICRNRIVNYREGDLHRYLHGVSETESFQTTTLAAASRVALEHFHPGRWILAAFPLDAWPHLQRLMRIRSRRPGQWGGKLTGEEAAIAKWVLREIANRGPLGSEHLAYEGSSHNGWNQSRTVKVVLDKLFAHGKLLISRRLKGRRIYDLPDRILPESILSLKHPTPLQTDYWLAQLKLRQHRLTTLTRDEFSLVRKQVLEIDVPDCGPLYLLKSDEALLDTTIKNGDRIPACDPLLLAPLDPIILNRSITRKLWEFDYTWEVYTPPSKRIRGYYALPILHNTEMAGHVDVKVDRRHASLRVQTISNPNDSPIEPALHRLAHFLGL